MAESGQTPDLTTNQITLRNMEAIDIAGTGDNCLVISVEALNNVTSDFNTLIVRHDLGDVITFGTGWTAQKPQFMEGVFVHFIAEAATGGTARVEVINERIYQHLLSTRRPWDHQRIVTP